MYSSISDEGKPQMIHGLGMFCIKIANSSFISGGYPCYPVMFSSLGTIKRDAMERKFLSPVSAALIVVILVTCCL